MFSSLRGSNIWFSHTVYRTRTFSNCLFYMSCQIFGLFVFQNVKHIFFFTFTASNCRKPWYTYKSGCFRLMQPRKDWVAANQHCGTFKTPCGGNGRLISIFSQDDNHQIGSLKSLRGYRRGMVSQNYFRVIKPLFFLVIRDSKILFSWRDQDVSESSPVIQSGQTANYNKIITVFHCGI